MVSWFLFCFYDSMSWQFSLGLVERIFLLVSAGLTYVKVVSHLGPSASGMYLLKSWDDRSKWATYFSSSSRLT